VTEQVEKTVTFLSTAIDGIQLPEDISKVLCNQQLDHISCSALNLEAAIMNCLSIAIAYAASKAKGESVYILFCTNCISVEKRRIRDDKY
jgi:hypothetical protein